MKKSNPGTFSFKTDRGLIRTTNDDACKVVTNSKQQVLMIVCDGMGGAKKGDYASNLCVNYLCEEFSTASGFSNIYTAKFWLDKKLKKVNGKLYDLQLNNKEYKGMGTTLVCVLIIKNKIILINAGDSRCYFYKNGNLKQISEDQTYTNYLYNVGKIGKEELNTDPNRHVLTNAVGLFPSISYDYKIIKYEGNSILLCSDGLYNNVSNNDIFTILATTDNCDLKVENLISLANYNGGSDNISICLWEPQND